MSALRHASDDVVAQLLAAGPPVNHTAVQRRSPWFGLGDSVMSAAVGRGDPRWVAELLTRPGLTDADRDLALSFGLRTASLGVVDDALAAGADPNRRVGFVAIGAVEMTPRFSRVPLTAAVAGVEARNPGVVAHLLQTRRVSLDLPLRVHPTRSDDPAFPQGAWLLDAAVREGLWELAVDLRADGWPAAQTNDGDPLRWAAVAGRADEVRFLLALGYPPAALELDQPNRHRGYQKHPEVWSQIQSFVP